MPTTGNMKRLKQAFLVFLYLSVPLLTFAVYYPGLQGPFIFDDWPNLVQNEHLRIDNLNFASLQQAAYSTSSGDLKRPVSMLSFALNYYATGANPYFFKLTNVLIHLANGIGVFILTLLLLDAFRQRMQPGLTQWHMRWASALIAAAWLLHPLNLTSVLYVVQRMASLASFFIICGLILYLWGRQRLQENKGGRLPILASFIVFTPLAALSKENGLLLPLFMFIIEFTVFRFKAPTSAARSFLKGLFAVSVILPLIGFVAYSAWRPEWLLNGYAMRDFTLTERLFTEARVLWFYLKMIVLPATREMAIYHDDIAISHGLFDPLTTLFSVIGIAALLGGAWLLRNRLPILFFGVLFFFAGHAMESTVLALEIAHEHRNYLPIYGILLPLFYYLLHPLSSPGTLRFRYFAAVFLIGLFAFNTASRAQNWSNLFDLSQYEVDNHPNSPRANLQMGYLYSRSIINGPDGVEINYPIAREYLERSSMLQKNFTVGLFELIHLNSSRGKIPEKNWLIDLSNRLENEPFSANSSNSLVKLESCQVKGDCKLSNEEMDELLKAALRNPTLSGLNKASVLFAMADHIHHASQNDVQAIKLAFQAVDAAPGESQYRFTLIQFLIGLRQFNLAQQQLTLVRKLDEKGIYLSAIEKHEKILISEQKPGAFNNAATIPIH